MVASGWMTEDGVVNPRFTSPAHAIDPDAVKQILANIP